MEEIKNERKERQIGEEFEVNGVRLRVEEAKSMCESCFLCHDHDCKKTLGECTYCDRTDGKDVIAVPVNGLKEECRIKFTGKNLNDVAALRCVCGFEADYETGEREWLVKYAGKDCHLEYAHQGVTIIQMNDGTGRVEK